MPVTNQPRDDRGRFSRFVRVGLGVSRLTDALVKAGLSSRMQATLGAFHSLANPAGPDSALFFLEGVKRAQEAWRLESRNLRSDDQHNAHALIGGRIGLWLTRAYLGDVDHYGAGPKPPIGQLADFSPKEPLRGPISKMPFDLFPVAGTPFMGFDYDGTQHPLWRGDVSLDLADTHEATESLLRSFSTTRSAGDAERLLVLSTRLARRGLSKEEFDQGEGQLRRFHDRMMEVASLPAVKDPADSKFDRDQNQRVFLGRMLGIIASNCRQSHGLEPSGNAPIGSKHSYIGRSRYGPIYVGPSFLVGLPVSIRKQADAAASG